MLDSRKRPGFDPRHTHLVLFLSQLIKIDIFFFIIVSVFTKAEHIHLLFDTSIEVIEMRMPIRMIPPSVIHPPMMPYDLQDKYV